MTGFGQATAGFRTPARAAKDCRRRDGKTGAMPLRLLLSFTILAGLSGCSLGTLWPSVGQGPETPSAALAAQPAAAEVDPIRAFAASAPAQESAMLIGADGHPVEVRVERVYTAASGRLCKTLSLRGPGVPEHNRVACTDGTGPDAGWQLARPLMAGGRPPVFR